MAGMMERYAALDIARPCAVALLVVAVGGTLACEKPGTGDDQDASRAASQSPAAEAKGAVEEEPTGEAEDAGQPTEAEKPAAASKPTPTEAPVAIEAEPLAEGVKRVAEARVTPGSDARLVVHTEPFDRPPLCDGGQQLVFRLHQGEVLVDERRIKGSCSGACTEEKLRRGEERVARVEEMIEAGEAGISELDYNYTKCIPLEQHLGEDLSEAVGRATFVVETDVLGPHDIKERKARLVTAGCGGVHASKTFRNPHAAAYAMDYSTLHVAPSEGEKPWENFMVELADAHVPADDEPALKPAVRASFDDERCAWSLDILDD
jgi:hypothetical protein